MPEPDAEGLPPKDALLTEQYARVAQAYGQARAFVFDAYPDGMPPRAQLTSAQRRRLDELEAAEAELKRLRRERLLGRRADEDEAVRPQGSGSAAGPPMAPGDLTDGAQMNQRAGRWDT